MGDGKWGKVKMKRCYGTVGEDEMERVLCRKGRRDSQKRPGLRGREVRLRCDGEECVEGNFREEGCHWPHQPEPSFVTHINIFASRIQ